METKESQESLQSHLSFSQLGRLFSSDRDDYLETGLKATQHKEAVLFGKLKLTNFIKNQFKVLKKINKGNTVIIRRPVTNPTENIKVFDAEFNPKKFHDRKFQI